MSRSRIFLFAAIVSVFLGRVASAGPANVIVDLKNEYILGALENGKWRDSASASAMLKPGTSLRAYALDREIARVTTGKAETMSEPCPDTHTVKISAKQKDALMALSASWNALPRKPRSADVTQQVYVETVREFLKQRGLANAKIKISQILRIDLDGDGEDEVLISATDYGTAAGEVPSNSPGNSYSVVLLRRVVAGKVKTQLVAGEFYPKPKQFSAPNRYRVLCVLDLDGDGKMEVIVDSQYYEGGATTIYRCTPSKVEELLTTGCGA